MLTPFGFETFTVAAACSAAVLGMVRALPKRSAKRKRAATLAAPAAAREEADESAEDATREFAFSGRHLLASYSGCSPAALCDIEGLTAALEGAVAASGATMLQSVRHVFEPNGMTAVVLLSESHASIHTYPEHRACFVDIFTCGSRCEVEAFDGVLRDFLRPRTATRRIIQRYEQMVDEVPDSVETV